MTPNRIGGAFAGLAALAILAFLPASARSQDQPSSAVGSPPVAASSATPAAAAAPTGATVHEMREEATKRSIAADVRKTLDNQAQPSPSPGALSRVIKKLTPERVLRDKEFKVAAAEFPEFCHQWEQKLREREENNLQHLLFQLKDGWETTTYTGYGKVTSCEAHESKDGFAIGRLTYEEFIYYLTGKTEDDARHASPKTVSDTHTTEIFRWDHNKWFY